LVILEEMDMTLLDQRIRFLKPLGFPDYIWLQKNALCVISDSGTITEESSILGFPAVTIRQAHERPEGMDEATLIMCGLIPEDVLKATEITIKHFANGAKPFKIVPDYDVDNVSQKVLRIIMSYTEYINRTVWFKK
jgi:UDP-N-acetylglucosamine 2-epimerase (non-hydrolysing)